MSVTLIGPRKSAAFGAPRDSAMKANAWPPGQTLLSLVATGVLGGLKIGGMSIFPTRRQDVTLLGALGLVTSIGISMAGAQQFRQHKNPIPHGYKVQTIVQKGIYQFTRNPMYVGMVGAVGSLGLIVNSFWGFLFQAYLYTVLSYKVIPFEEEYLQVNFGKEYLDYKAKVPRWLLF